MADRSDVEFAVGLATMLSFMLGPMGLLMTYVKTGSAGMAVGVGLAGMVTPFLLMAWIGVGLHTSRCLTDTVHEMLTDGVEN